MSIERESLKFVIKSLVAKQRHKEAFSVIDHFFELAEDLADYDALGEMSLIAKYYSMQLKCAIAAYTRASTSEELFSARENLFKSYNTMNYPEKALFYIEQNLRIKPDDFDLRSQKGFTLALMGQRKESEEILESLMAEDEKQREGLEFALSGKAIREGHTAIGIKRFIATFKPKNYLFEDRLKLKLWDGAPQPGRTIVVNGEGGIGDELINIRFFKNLEDFGMKPILYSSWYQFRPDLVDLFRRHGYKVVTNSMFFHKDWLWTHMMPLPGYLGLTEAELWRGPYLTPKRDPKNKLDDTNFKIGIKCSGNPYFEQDVYRCIPIEEILAALPKGVSVYYFDKEHTHPDTISLKDKLETWDDTLDYIDQMDVIVSSCTSLVHAAGAMGKQTMVITPIAEYYTWTSTRTDESTPWYGENFKLLKQQKLRSWKEPLARVSQLLEELLKGNNSK